MVAAAVGGLAGPRGVADRDRPGRPVLHHRHRARAAGRGPRMPSSSWWSARTWSPGSARGRTSRPSASWSPWPWSAGPGTAVVRPRRVGGWSRCRSPPSTSRAPSCAGASAQVSRSKTWSPMPSSVASSDGVCTLRGDDCRDEATRSPAPPHPHPIPIRPRRTPRVRAATATRRALRPSATATPTPADRCFCALAIAVVPGAHPRSSSISPGTACTVVDRRRIAPRSPAAGGPAARSPSSHPTPITPDAAASTRRHPLISTSANPTVDDLARRLPEECVRRGPGRRCQVG